MLVNQSLSSALPILVKDRRSKRRGRLGRRSFHVRNITAVTRPIVDRVGVDKRMTGQWLRYHGSGGWIVDIATLKQHARDCEKRGDTAAALETYEQLLRHFESSGIQPEGPFYVKVGDLSLKTGQKEQALEMFERAAEQYARLGSEKSVIALCLKVLRTDATRADVYVRFARNLLRHGHAEQARLVLMDYAERARLRKTLATLERLGTRPEAELRSKLERFFETVDRGAQQPKSSGERVPQFRPRPSQPMSQTSEHLALMVDANGHLASPIAPTAPPPTPTVQAALVVTEIAPMPEPAIAKRVVAEPRRTPEPVSLPEAHFTPTPRPEPVAARTAPRRAFGTLWSDRQAVPVWAWPAAAVVALVILAAGLFAFGAIPFGGDLGAEQPDAKGTHVPITRIMTAATFEEPEGPRSPSEIPTSDLPMMPDQAQELDPVGTQLFPGQQDGLEPGTPATLDPRALTAAREAALSLSGTDVDVPAGVDARDVGRINVPTGAPLSSGTRRTAAAASDPSNTQPVIVIEGLVIEGVARLPTSYQVVQRTASGRRVALTVVPFSEAPANDTGSLTVRVESGDSAMGTVRFGDSYVTARAAIAPAEMERLLGRLVEQAPRDVR